MMDGWLEFLPRLLGALSLVAVAIGISVWQRLHLEGNMLVAVVRAFLQLLILGFALQWVFGLDALIAIPFALAVMFTAAGITAGSRAKGIPNGGRLAAIAIVVGGVLTLGVLVLLQVFPFTPRYIIPIAGMIIGNSMVVTGLVMSSLRDGLQLQRLEVETALALGATPKQAAAGQLRRALATGMTPIIDNTKTVGLVALPGAMTGMLIAGAEPLAAVQLQIIVMYMLVGAASLAGLTAAYLCFRQFFSDSSQLQVPMMTDH